ncbi:diguanylate cyclase domain-containing protein [Kineococcus esterisolvens]|uniref:diguanylate cyclase domain-containing protein n=1 Tax=unclassified Kineococcus TaxID=2621656 RepID=UPI003D7E3E7E
MNHHPLRGAAVPAGFTLLHVVAVLLGRASALDGAALALVWPAAGVGFVWLARSWRSPRALRRDAGLLLASGVLAQVATGQPPLLAALLGTSGLVQALTACWVHRRLQRRGSRLRQPQDLWALLAGAAAGAGAGAVVGCTTAVLLLHVPLGPGAFTGWVVRHTASTVVLAVVWLRAGDRRAAPAPAVAGPVEALTIGLGACAGLTWLYEQPGRLALSFLVVPFSVWAGLRLSARTALATTVTGSLGLVVATHGGHGPFQDLPGPERVLDAQLLVLVLTVVATLLVLHREERGRLDAGLQRAYRGARAQSALLATSERRFRLAFDTAPVAMLMVGLNGGVPGRVLQANPTAAAFTGLDPADLTGRPFADLLHPDDREGHLAALAGLAALAALAADPRGESGHARIEGRYRHADGGTRWGLLAATAVPAGEAGTAPYLLCLVEDVTARRAAEAALVHQARHDALTGLPNRVLLRERLCEALASGSAGVLYCDLDGFKDVNDTAGHGAGDDVLREVAARFGACLRDGDTLARLGGDEFALVLPGAAGPGEPRAVGERLVAALLEPVVVAAGSFRVGVSIGVGVGTAAGPGGTGAGDRAEQLMAAADAAMYAAKRAGKGRVHVHAGSVALPRQVAALTPPSWESSSGGTRQ